jgi:type 1 fimbria pilin
MTITSVTRTDVSITATAGKFSSATTNMGIELTDAAGVVIRRKNQAVSPTPPVGTAISVTIAGLTPNTLYRVRMYAADAAEADL